MASPPKSGGHHGGDPVNITTLELYLLLDMPIVKDYKLRLVLDTVELCIHEKR